MKRFVFLLEEPSAREMLRGFLPKIGIFTEQTCFIVFQGKQDMMKNLSGKIRNWIAPETQFVIIRDQDAGDCERIKAELVRICQDAGHPDSLVRIACHELETFYLGDLRAVQTGLAISGIAELQKKRKYRNPDRLADASGELERLSGYRYQKLAGSRAIGPHLSIDNNTSASFRTLVAGLRKAIEQSSNPW